MASNVCRHEMNKTKFKPVIGPYRGRYDKAKDRVMFEQPVILEVIPEHLQLLRNGLAEVGAIVLEWYRNGKVMCCKCKKKEDTRKAIWTHGAAVVCVKCNDENTERLKAEEREASRLLKESARPRHKYYAVSQGANSLGTYYGPFSSFSEVSDLLEETYGGHVPERFSVCFESEVKLSRGERVFSPAEFRSRMELIRRGRELHRGTKQHRCVRQDGTR